MNLAPAFTARSTRSVVNTVPAPTQHSREFLCHNLIDSSAAAVLECNFCNKEDHP